MRTQARGFLLILVIAMLPGMLFLAYVVNRSVSSESSSAGQELARQRAFYLAETGLAVGFRALAESNFTGATLAPDGYYLAEEEKRELPFLKVLESKYPLTFDRRTGNYYWVSGQTVGSLTNTEAPESFRFSIHFPTEEEFVVRAEGSFAHLTATHELRGRLKKLSDYALYSAGDLSDFHLALDQTVTGDVHVNGDLFLVPNKKTLTMNSLAIRVGGRLFRHRDAWQRPDQGGTVKIGEVVMDGVSQKTKGKGQAFDSFHPQWNDPEQGAGPRFEETIVTGAARLIPPDPAAFRPGGYYSRQAGLIIEKTSDLTGVTDVVFENPSEGRSVYSKQIDLTQLNLPENGLIYSALPLRVMGGQDLSLPLTIVSDDSIYTVGDFNKQFPDSLAWEDKVQEALPAALLTRGRIYHLTAGFKDPGEEAKSPAPGQDPPLFKGDPGNILEINAVLVEGSPTVDELKFVKAQGAPEDRDKLPVRADSRDFLENLANFRVVRRGTLGHFNNATMADFGTVDFEDGETPWLVRSFSKYFKLDYRYDASFAEDPPPFVPRLAADLDWYDLGTEQTGYNYRGR